MAGWGAIKKFIYVFFAVMIMGGAFFYTFSCKAASFYKGEEIKSDAALIINTNTNMPIFEKNSSKRRSMASLTKIMTYIIVVEDAANKGIDMKLQKVKVKKEVLNLVDEDSSIAGLKEGDELTIFDLLHCLMIESGNDAALVLADYISLGNIENFINMMNKKAEEIECTDTHFVNPDGMYDENHYSTAWDIYKTIKYAMNCPYFMEICGKKEYKVFNDERPSLKTTNKMMNPAEKKYYCPYVKGIKTGWHSEAGRCLASYAVKGEVSYVCIVMGGPEIDVDGDGIEENLAMIDTKNIYTWLFENLALNSIINKNDPFGQVKLKSAWGKDKIVLSPERNVSLILPKEADISKIEVEYFLPNFISAPVETGDIIGTAKLKLDGETLEEVNLVSSEQVNFNFFVFIFEKIKEAISSKIFIACFVFFALAFFGYIFFTIFFNRNKKNRGNKKYIKIKSPVISIDESGNRKEK